MILVDTGPLVALIHEDDNEHRICKDTFLTFSEPLGTVWPVLTEALYLLNFSWEAQNALWEMIQVRAVEILPLGTDDVDRMRELMRKYRDLPMDLADAALVRVPSENGCVGFSPLTGVTSRFIARPELAVLRFFLPVKDILIRALDKYWIHGTAAADCIRRSPLPRHLKK